MRSITLHECFTQKVTPLVTHFHLNTHVTTCRLYSLGMHCFQGKARNISHKKWPQCWHISTMIFSGRHPWSEILNQKMLKILFGVQKFENQSMSIMTKKNECQPENVRDFLWCSKTWKLIYVRCEENEEISTRKC